MLFFRRCYNDWTILNVWFQISRQYIVRSFKGSQYIIENIYNSNSEMTQSQGKKRTLSLSYTYPSP